MLTTLMKTKKCTGCQQELPATLEFFHPQATGKYGLLSRCKKCKKLWNMEYYQTEIGKIANRRNNKKYYRTINGYLRHTFRNMIQRCTKLSHPNYKYYGGKGIKVCFKSVTEFIDYVVNTLQIDPRSLTIDRIDSNDHYKPGNIRFVTIQENLQNRRK